MTLKIMPTSPDVDMKKLGEAVKKKITSLGGKFHEQKEEPIAFGLKALICTLSWPEEKNPDIVESELAKVKNVNSVQLTDFRRAIA